MSGTPAAEGHPPASFEDFLVAQLAMQDGCEQELTVPPPALCPADVQSAYAVARWHPLTIVLGFMMIIFFLQLAFEAKGD